MLAWRRSRSGEERSQADVAGVVQMHLAAIPAFFLTFLLPRFLRLFYSEAVALGEFRYVEDSGPALVSILMCFGSELVRAFLDEDSRRNASHVDLTAEMYDNDRTNAFYRKLGFSLARTVVTPERRLSAEFMIDISSACGRRTEVEPSSEP